ncbi:PIN domain-containing protein [Microcoleus sp. herbarium12]|uniref:PIN domain-containing protein n=1 Tax=Microcoleus sp. herbarium12 TaxID=3055437 RepID=UPI002FD433DA
MRIQVDSNLILEALLNRTQFIGDARNCWLLLGLPHVQGYITESGLNQIRFHLSKVEDEQTADEVVSEIKKIINVCLVNRCIEDKARSLNIREFESAIEVACAIEMDVSAIVTQNPQKFEGSGLSILSVSDLSERNQLEERLNKPSLPSLPILQVGSLPEFRYQLNRSFYQPENPLQLCLFQTSEVESTLSYRIRNPIGTVLKVFKLLTKEYLQGITIKELSILTNHSQKTTQSIIWDFENFNMALSQGDRVVIQPYLLNLSENEVAEYLAGRLTNHVVTKEIYRQLEHRKIMTRWGLQELIADICPTKKPVSTKTSQDYTSRMLTWFLYTGLLEERVKDRFIKPLGEGKQKGKLIEEAEAKQLELFTESYFNIQIDLPNSRPTF